MSSNVPIPVFELIDGIVTTIYFHVSLDKQNNQYISWIHYETHIANKRCRMWSTSFIKHVNTRCGLTYDPGKIFAVPLRPMLRKYIHRHYLTVVRYYRLLFFQMVLRDMFLWLRKGKNFVCSFVMIHFAVVWNCKVPP